MSILETKDLIIGYDGKELIKDINIHGEKGILLCILGPNGAGKTTILRSISGLLPKINGYVYINSNELSEIDSKTLAKELSVVLTNKFEGGLMSVFEIVSMGRYPHTGFFGKLDGKDIIKINEALKVVNAYNLIGRSFDELSDGEKQKVLIARALVQEPDVIILDEPTTHLDIRHRIELVEILKKLSKEKNISVILSLHEIDIALKSCDKVLLISNREVQGYGTVEEIVCEDKIRNLYDIENATFNNLLGSIELANNNRDNTLVIAGAGTGTPIYRVLTKKNIGFRTGIIHRNDVDYEIARTMGVKIISKDSFEAINKEDVVKINDEIDKVDQIIDSNFPIREMNMEMINVIKYALDSKKKIISLRDKEEFLSIFKTKENVIFIDSICKLYKELTKGEK